MKIEAGKYYRTRDGRKVGPMMLEHWEDYPFGAKLESGDQLWTDLGARYPGYHSHPTDLIAEWTDEPAAPKTWGEMTDAEKGALLLAYHEGASIQYWRGGPQKKWADAADYKPIWADGDAYRVRPPEPVRETFIRHIRRFGEGWLMSKERIGSDTHRITFPVVDREITTGTYTNEDGERIVVERVND